MKALFFDGDMENPKIEHIEIENTLETLQQKVGGYIECVTIDHGFNVVICDADGRFKPHKREFFIGPAMIGFVGKVLIVGAGEDGEFYNYDSVNNKDFSLLVNGVKVEMKKSATAATEADKPGRA